MISPTVQPQAQPVNAGDTVVEVFQPQTEAERQDCQARFKAFCFLMARLVLKYSEKETA